MGKSITDDLKNLKPKSIDNYEIPLNDLHDPWTSIENKIKSVDRNSKKSVMTLELLKEEIEEKNKLIFSLNNELKDKEEGEQRIFKKILLVLNQVDNIYRFAYESNNEALIQNLDTILKIIKKEMRDIGLEEIPTVGEIFNSKLHKCVDVMIDDSKQKNEITDVIERGYTLNGKVLKVASVISVK